jgi:hypothetical protein
MKFIQIFTAFAIFSVLAFSSCKKTSSSVEELTELETTFDLAAKGAISENLTQDVQKTLFEAAIKENFLGSGVVAGTVGVDSFPGCATITDSSVGTGFPKVYFIDYGTTTGCSGKTGKIKIVLTDSLRKVNSMATVTFINYTIGNYKKEGTIKWTNTSTGILKRWNRKCTGGKITSIASGNFWLHDGEQNITQTAGYSTPLNDADDVFNILVGSTRNVTNAAGSVRNGIVLTDLQKKTNCDNIDKGSYKIQGPNHVAIIDFGNGICDNQATISIDGRPVRNFTLR